MITIKEIIHLCRSKQLKKCVFVSGDAANSSIVVDENSIPVFRNGNKIFDLAQEEIDRIDEENDYFYSFHTE